MDRNEVRYVRGSPFSGYYPTHQQKLIDEGKDNLDALLGSVIKTAELPKGLSTNDAAYWAYKSSDAFTRIYFDENDRVKRIECNVVEYNYRYACDLISNIGIGSSEDKVKNVFGTPDSESISDYGSKRLRFDKYNVEFRLIKQQVTEIIVGEASLPPPKKKELKLLPYEPGARE